MKYSVFTSLRARLIALILLTATPALIFIIYSDLDLRKQAEEDALDQAQQVVDLSAKTQQQLIEATHQLLAIMAQMPQVRQGDGAICSAFLAGLLSKYPRYANFGAMRRNGDIFCSALPLINKINSSDRLYFQRALSTRAVALGEYQIGRITGKPTVNMGYPILGQHGEAQAVIFAAIDLNWLKQLAHDSSLPLNSSFLMTDSNGTVLLQYPDSGEWVGKSIAHTGLFGATHNREVTRIPGLDGVERVYVFATLSDASGEPEAYFSVGVPTTVAFAEANKILLSSLIGFGVVIVLMFVLAWIGGDILILSRVEMLLSAVRRVTAGDLAVRTQISARNDEIGELAHAFDNMAEELEHREARIRHDEGKIARLNRVHVLLSSINSAIIRIHERDTLLREACHISADEGRFKLAYVSLLDTELFSLVPAYVAGSDIALLQTIRLRLPENPSDATNITGNTLLAGEAVVVNDLKQGSSTVVDKAILSHHGYRSCALLPLKITGKVTGCLHLYSGETGFFDEEEMKLLQDLAANISLGLEYIEKENKIQSLVNYDLLTGMPNRGLYRDRLEQSLARAKHHGRHVAVMTLHIDKLKEINSIHGQHTGDMLLRAAAHRLHDLVREGDTVARASSSVFNIALADVAHTGDVITVARKIINAFAEPILVEGNELFVVVHLGIAVYPDDSDDIETILKNAEIALNISRRETGNVYRFYTPEINTRAMERFEIERELRHALDRNEFTLHYQPVVDMKTGKITGCEALLRWRNQTLGAVSPARFIPVAEETDLIIPIGEWVLRTASEQANQWRGQGLTLRLAVNVSTKQLRRATFPDRVLTILHESGFNPATHDLTMEITETQLMENAERSANFLKNLQTKGLSVSIDDFGTGYSSLSYLKRLPVDTLKIDISFIRDITRNHDDAAIVKAIIALAHSLEMNVVAEGVETREQFAALLALGCDAAQGFLFSPAVLPADFKKLSERCFV